MGTESRPGSDGGAIEHAADRVLRFPLTTAGYAYEDARGWIWNGGDAFVGISVRVVPEIEAADASRPGGIAITMGWRYARLGDPEPSPATAEGCVRQLSIDDVAADAGVRLTALPAPQEVGAWEQRLATVVQTRLLGWFETWKRPDGLRDFLAERRFHLAAAWFSALLGHRERVELELRASASLMAADLRDGFDRRRADLDESFVAPLAARHGLGAFLTAAEERGDHRSLQSFGGTRAAIARERVTEPELEHARLLRRHEVFSALCLQYLEATPAAR